MMDRQMLTDMWNSGATAAAEDIADTMAYDPDYAYDHANALALQLVDAAHLSSTDGRDLATEWMDGYQTGYRDEME